MLDYLKWAIGLAQNKKVQDWYFCRGFNMDKRKLDIWGEIAVNEKSYVAFKFIHILWRVMLEYFVLAILTGVAYAVFMAENCILLFLCLGVSVVLFVGSGVLCYSTDCMFNKYSVVARRCRALLCIFLLVGILNIPFLVVYVSGALYPGTGGFVCVLGNSQAFNRYVEIAGALFVIFSAVTALFLLKSRKDALVLVFSSRNFPLLDFFVIHYKNGGVEKVNVEEWDIRVLDTQIDHLNDIMLVNRKGDGTKPRIVLKSGVTCITNCDRKLIFEDGKWKIVGLSLDEYCQGNFSSGQ